MTIVRATACFAVCALAGAVLLSGCASPGGGTGITASDATRVTRSGFLSDYDRLRPSPAADGLLCWRIPDTNWKQYDKVLIERMQVTLKPGGQRTIDPTDLKTLVDYFHDALVRALKPQAQIVDKAGAGVLRIRIALTDLVPTSVSESLLGTAVPYGFVVEAGSGVASGRPAGSTPYLGETGIEAQFRDGASGNILAECADTELGRKYAADLNASASGAAQTWVGGYLSSFSAWSYAKDAFDKWAALTARRLAELRGLQTPR